jgi:hypothetical protein
MHACLIENFQVYNPDGFQKLGGGQYYSMDAICKYLDCPVTSDVDYRGLHPDRDIDFVEYLDQDFACFVASSPWHPSP